MCRSHHALCPDLVVVLQVGSSRGRVGGEGCHGWLTAASSHPFSRPRSKPHTQPLACFPSPTHSWEPELTALRVFLCSRCDLCCCLIPCLFDDFKDVTHTCPNCKAYIYTYKRMC